jgi:type VI secretion system secreted protein Hcp
MHSRFRTSIRRSLAVVVAMSLFGAGYLVHVGVDSSSGRPASAPVATKKLSLDDLLLAAQTAQGIHLRYTGITTGALNASHTNDIQLQSFQFGVSRPVSGTGAGRTAGTVSVGEITVTHQTDKYSIPLLRASLTGTPVTSTVYFTNLAGSGGAPFDYLEVSLTETLISAFSSSSGGTLPSESFSLNFVAMTFKYRIAGTTTVQTVSYTSNAPHV